MDNQKKEVEREQFEKWAKARSHDIVSRLHDGRKAYNSSFTAYLWQAWQARAAIKAQPAPTEAQEEMTYTVDGEVMSPLEYINYLHGQIKMQGEDSARLEWLIENVCSGSIGFSNGDFIGSQDFDELKSYIDAARAAPQPQEQS